jgi:hypothetical protein
VCARFGGVYNVDGRGNGLLSVHNVETVKLFHILTLLLQGACSVHIESSAFRGTFAAVRCARMQRCGGYANEVSFETKLVRYSKQGIHLGLVY